MTTPEIDQPVEDKQLSVERFLNKPEDLRRRLLNAGTFDFTQYESGLFPASDLDAQLAEVTAMDMAWFRDNAHVANALLECGYEDKAVSAGIAMLTALHKNTNILDGVIDGTLDYRQPENRLPVRVNGNTLENDKEYRIQNDSVGYPLWFISKLGNEDLLDPTEAAPTLAKIVKYLGKIEYWQDYDEQGHWEESHRLHAASIGVVVAGLKETKKLFEKIGYIDEDIDFDDLIGEGTTAMNEMIDSGMTERADNQSIAAIGETALPENLEIKKEIRDSMDDFADMWPRGRKYDASMLYLTQPLGLLDDERAAKIVADVEKYLIGEKGIKRYLGDTYWGPEFTKVYKPGDRTIVTERNANRDDAAEGIYYTGTEAQWTLFDPILSTYWGEQYKKTGEPKAREKQLEYLNRSLSQLVETQTGKLHLPEAYYHESFQDDTTKTGQSNGKLELVPNEHTPLLWSQANLLKAVRVFEETNLTTLA